LLDNQGGFSHAGRRLELHPGSSYTEIRYTDVIGDARKTSGGYTSTTKVRI